MGAALVGYEREHPASRGQIDQMQRRELPDGWDADIPTFDAGREGDGDPQGLAPGPERDRPEGALAAQRLGRPHRLGLERARLRRRRDFEPGDRAGRNLHYGIREHESAAISNGLSLSKLRPVWSTYLIFSDYARPAIRLSALMELPVIHWFSHDSIGLGEDGPTHQPVEQLASLRAIPGLNVIRPCDANEVAEAWRVIMQLRHEPVALVLTPPGRADARPQPLRLGRRPRPRRLRARRLADGEPEVILIATGSEVAPRASTPTRSSRAEGVQRAGRQPPLLASLRPAARGLPRERPARRRCTARVAVEQASTLGWDRYVGPRGGSSACTPSAPRRR